MSGMRSSMRGSGVAPASALAAHVGTRRATAEALHRGRSSSAVDKAAQNARRWPRSQPTATDMHLWRERALAVLADAKQ